MSTPEERLRSKIPGKDTGIVTRNSFCDICSPGLNCGVPCYVKGGKILKIEGMEAHPTNRGLLCTKGLAGRRAEDSKSNARLGRLYLGEL